LLSDAGQRPKGGATEEKGEEVAPPHSIVPGEGVARLSLDRFTPASLAPHCVAAFALTSNSACLLKPPTAPANIIARGVLFSNVAHRGPRRCDERQAVEFGVEIGEYLGGGRVPRRLPTPTAGTSNGPTVRRRELVSNALPNAS